MGLNKWNLWPILEVLAFAVLHGHAIMIRGLVNCLYYCSILSSDYCHLQFSLLASQNQNQWGSQQGKLHVTLVSPPAFLSHCVSHNLMLNLLPQPLLPTSLFQITACTNPPSCPSSSLHKIPTTSHLKTWISWGNDSKWDYQDCCR